MPIRPPASPVAMTMGDPAGIGPEIALKAWLARDGDQLSPFFLIADPAVMARTAQALGLAVPLVEIASPAEVAALFQTALPVLPVHCAATVDPGTATPANAPATLDAIAIAVRLAQSGQASAMVTNPIHKAALYAAGFRHPGHTEYIAELCGAAAPVMMLSCPGLNVVPVTIHVALADVPARLSVDAIVKAGRITADGLRRDFGIARPRLAIAGLNPHAGEHGTIGREEIDTIAPAAKILRDSGLDVHGPAPADSLFHAAARAHYDAVLCMYHDQALIPLKTIDFDHGVNATLGLPIIRTSPDHGTAFDIAGRGIASPASLIAALRQAARMAIHRAAAA